MNIRYIAVLYTLIIFIGGCANKEIIQSYIPIEAQGEEIVDAITMGCNSPYTLKQDCDSWQGANRLIEIKTLKMRVASSQSGKLILIMSDTNECKYGSFHCSTVANNRNFEVVKNLLHENNINILKVIPVVRTEYISGYLIFVSKDGYSLIKEYTLSDATKFSNSKKKNLTTNKALLPSDYDKNLITPQETDDFILIGKEIFDQPTLGTMLRYENKNFPEDNITLFVYPIPTISWDNAEETINQELDYALEEIDLAVKQGLYKSREIETKSNFKFTHKTQAFNGVRTNFKLTDKTGALHYSSTYLFILEDKFVKFRISVNSHVSKETDNSSIIENLLPLIKVPVESEYMANVRAEHREKIQREYVEQLLQNSF
jgi:hypothetical protein